MSTISIAIHDKFLGLLHHLGIHHESSPELEIQVIDLRAERPCLICGKEVDDVRDNVCTDCAVDLSELDRKSLPRWLYQIELNRTLKTFAELTDRDEMDLRGEGER